MASGDGSRGSSVISTSIAFTAVAFLIVCLRIVTRTVIAYSVGPEDYMIILAMEVKYGAGKHVQTLTPGDLEMSLKYLYASILVYNASLTLTKCSLLLQYIRLFVLNITQRICWVTFGIVCAYFIANLIGSIFQCTPIAYFWNKFIKDGHCVNILAFYFSNAVFNIISDLAIIIIPIPVLKSLHLPTRQKVGLLLIFGVGAFACVTSILRLHSLYVFSVSSDSTWDNASIATWSAVEVNVGIICACLPTMKPLFMRFVPRLLGSNLHTRMQTATAKLTSTFNSNRNTMTGTMRQQTRSSNDAPSQGDDTFDMAIRANGDHKVDVKHTSRSTDDEDTDGDHDSAPGANGRERPGGGKIKVVQVFQIEHQHSPSHSPQLGSDEIESIA